MFTSYRLVWLKIFDIRTIFLGINATKKENVFFDVENFPGTYSVYSEEEIGKFTGVTVVLVYLIIYPYGCKV